MKSGTLLTGVIAAVALGGVLVAFSSSASPYVTIPQAKTAQGDRLHVAGQLDKTSIKRDLTRMQLSFRLKDENGNVLPVEYRGDMPANLENAVQIVAVGKMVGDTFQSRQLIVKCPSKYEGEKLEEKTYGTEGSV